MTSHIERVRETAERLYGELVDRLLASPRYGERWAWDWLDVARYADTNGFQGDPERTMWPWRDWLVRSLNADVSLDVLTEQLLAGDLLSGAEDQQRLATAFHRNTMSNDEGGTDDEEFRSIAVKDRVVRDGNLFTGGGITAGIDFALVLAAELFDADTAQLVQLQLEYAPAPPFNSGSPETAPSAIVDEARLRAAPSLKLRTEITERAAAKLNLH